MNTATRLSLTLAVGTLSAALLQGCAASAKPKLSPEQLSAIQTREIEAPVDATFRAAAGVMMDSGMVIAMSDRAAGLVSGATWGYVGNVGHAQRTEWGGVLVWVHPGSGGRTSMRVSFGGAEQGDNEQVSRFAAQVQERVLMASDAGGQAK